MPINQVQKFLSEPKLLKIKWMLNSNSILIYQMGKVGSTTVFLSLKKHLSLTPVFHLHFLSDRSLKEQEEYYRSVGKDPQKIRHLRHSNLLKNKLDRSAKRQCKIITLVRDPIAREISMFFQKKDKNFPDGIDTKTIIEILQNQFKSFDESKDLACNWFDEEIKANFNIDVYKFEFDKQKGYQIIRTENAEVLTIRLENLNQCFQTALSEFLISDRPIEMISENTSKEKDYKKQYREVINKITIPEEICRTIYSSRHMKHFYSEDKIEEFILKWTKKSQ